MPITGWPSASGRRHGQRSKTKRPSACVGGQAAKEFVMKIFVAGTIDAVGLALARAVHA
jgi:hypothetical protein